MDDITRTVHEHAHMLLAVHTLEKALASPAPGREVAWKRQAGAALVVVGDELEQHIDSAEGDDGLIANMEAQIGRTREVTEALTSHTQLLDEVRTLLSDLANRAEDEGLRYDEVRTRAADLTEGLRQHQALENDLIFLALGQDVSAMD